MYPQAECTHRSLQTMNSNNINSTLEMFQLWTDTRSWNCSLTQCQTKTEQSFQEVSLKPQFLFHLQEKTLNGLPVFQSAKRLIIPLCRKCRQDLADAHCSSTALKKQASVALSYIKLDMTCRDSMSVHISYVMTPLTDNY